MRTFGFDGFYEISLLLLAVYRDFLDPAANAVRIFHRDFISSAPEKAFCFETFPFMGNAGINFKSFDRRMNAEHIIQSDSEKPSR